MLVSSAERRFVPATLLPSFKAPRAETPVAGIIAKVEPMPVKAGSGFDDAYWSRMTRLAGHGISHTPPPIFHHDNTEALQARLAMIRSAKSSIALFTYAVECDQYGDQILDALTERAKAGVKVCLKIDDLAEKIVGDDASRVRKKHFYQKVKDFVAAGGLFEEYGWEARHTFAFGDHMKALVIDGARAMVGGRNIGKDDFHPGSSDLDMEIGDTAVFPIVDRLRKTLMQANPRETVKDFSYATAFLHFAFPHADDTNVRMVARRNVFLARFNMDIAAAKNQATDSGKPLLVMTFNPTEDKRTTAPGEHENSITQAFIDTIDRAKHVLILSSNFINGGKEFMAALFRAAKRGVKIHIVTNGRAVSLFSVMPYMNAHRLYGDLRRAGIAIWETNEWSHRKLFVADNEVAALGGSYNFERAAEKKLCEDVSFTSDPDMVREVQQTLRKEIKERCTLYLHDIIISPRTFWEALAWPFVELYELAHTVVAHYFVDVF